MHDFTIGDYQIGRITKVPAINYAYPLTGRRRRQLEGVVFVVQNLELAHDGARERRISAGRRPGGDRSQWNGARAHARSRRLDRQDAARTAGPRDRVRARGTAGSSKPIDAQGVEPAVGARSAHPGARPARDDGNVQGGRVRRHQSPPDAQSRRAGARDDRGADRRMDRGQVHPAPGRCPGRGDQEARDRRARHAGARARRPQRARSPRPCVQLDGHDVAGARPGAPHRGGKEPTRRKSSWR